MWNRRSKSKGLVVLLAVFLGGYAFFFSSNLWMPPSGNATKQSPLNREMEWEGRMVTLLRWEYAKDEHKMEVELAIENMSFDGITAYTYYALDSSNRKLKVTPVLEDSDYVVLQLTGISSRWSEVSLRIELPENAGGTEEASTLRLYTNVVDVQTVEKLPVLTRKGYLMKRLEEQVAHYEEEIKVLWQEIQSQGEYQENCEEEIQRLTGNKKYQTEEEIAETDRLIQTARQKTEASKESVHQLEKSIAELQEKIEKTNEKKAVLQAEGGHVCNDYEAEMESRKKE